MFCQHKQRNKFQLRQSICAILRRSACRLFKQFYLCKIETIRNFILLIHVDKAVASGTRSRVSSRILSVKIIIILLDLFVCVFSVIILQKLIAKFSNVCIGIPTEFRKHIRFEILICMCFLIENALYERIIDTAVLQ